MAEASRVLVVDDDSEMVVMLEMALAGSGYEVAAAGSGEDALQAVAAAKPDLILLDLRMPDMDGKQFASVLHERYGHRIPIILITGVTEGRENALEVGAEGYVAKPFDLDDLLASVGRCLGRDNR